MRSEAGPAAARESAALGSRDGSSHARQPGGLRGGATAAGDVMRLSATLIRGSKFYTLHRAIEDAIRAMVAYYGVADADANHPVTPDLVDALLSTRGFDHMESVPQVVSLLPYACERLDMVDVVRVAAAQLPSTSCRHSHPHAAVRYGARHFHGILGSLPPPSCGGPSQMRPSGPCSRCEGCGPHLLHSWRPHSSPRLSLAGSALCRLSRWGDGRRVARTSRRGGRRGRCDAALSPGSRSVRVRDGAGGGSAWDGGRYCARARAGGGARGGGAAAGHGASHFGAALTSAGEPCRLCRRARHAPTCRPAPLCPCAPAPRPR